MDFSKMTLKEAAKLGFLMGLASPAFVFTPSNVSYPQKQSVQNGLVQDELKVLEDYGYKLSES